MPPPSYIGRAKRSIRERALLLIPWVLSGLIGAGLLSACAASSTATRAANLEKLRKTVQYSAVRIGPFVASADAKVNMPPQGPISDTRHSAVLKLQATRIFESVEEVAAEPPPEGAMIVQAVFTIVRIEEIARIWGANIWGGKMPSSMQCHVRLIDGNSLALIHEKDLEVQNYHDREVPSMMGEAIADYVLAHAADRPPG